MEESDSQSPDGERNDSGSKAPNENTASKSSDPSTNPGKESLELELQKVGLNVNEWSNHLQTECGVTEYRQLKFLQSDSEFKKLQKHTKHSWEVNALRELLGIGSRYDADHSEKAEAAKQQVEEAKKFLAEIQSMAKEGKDRTDALVTEKETQLRQALQLPDDAWIKGSKGMNIDNVIDKFSSQLGKLQQLETDRKELSPKELLEKASGGLALTGVLLTKHNKDYGIKRRTIIKAPEVVVLKSPNSSQIDNVVEFSSKEQSDSFDRTLDTMGHSAAVSIKGGYWLFQAEAGESESHRKESQKESEHHETKTYISRLIYSCVPTAVCELQKRELKFCEDAIKELKELETLIECADNENVIQKKSQDFLRKYGSHVNVANIEFGGIYQWKATFYEETESKKEKLQAMVNDALSTHVSASYGVPLVGPCFGVAISGDKQTGNVKVNASNIETDISRTTIKTEKKGGPQEVSELPLWKLGVIRYNKTWDVIGRGRNECDLVGIWELISNHSNEFSNASKLERFLQQAWHSLGGLGESDGSGKILDAKRSMDKMLQDVQGWLNDASLSVNAVRYLKAIYEQIGQCNSVSGKLSAGTLENETMSKFLTRVMEMNDDYTPSNLAELKGYMTKMLNETGNFQLKSRIILWAKVDDNEGYHSKEQITNIKDIPGLVSVVKKDILPRMQIMYAKENTSSDTIERQATKDLSLEVRHLQKLLDESDLFFLCSALLPLRYNSELNGFEQLVTEDNLKKLIRDLEENWKKYHSFKETLKRQAFLVNFLVLSIPQTQDELKETMYHKCMKIIESKLVPELKSKLPGASNAIVWTDLNNLLRSTMEGNDSDDRNGTDLTDLREILSQYHDPQTQRESPNCLFHPTPDAKELLIPFGLSEYYPSKITLQDVMAVQKREYKNEQDLPNLPWLILKRLIMLDYQGRESDLSNIVSTDKQNAREEPVEKSMIDDFMNDFASKQEDGRTFNPLDVLVVIYACCDMALKQTLLQKMFICRLAVPFVSPLLSGSLSYSLWAMRSIIVDWKDREGICKQASVVDEPTNVVTFLRLGQSSFSKSHLLNNILSDEAHPTFWNRECPLGDTKKSVAKGLVEAQWYLPKGDDEDIFKKITMFLNLRGNVCEHEPQRKLIEKISNVAVCFLDTTDLDDSKVLETMKSIHDSSLNVILFLTMKQMDEKVRAQLKDYFAYVGDEHKHSTKLMTSLKREKQPKTTEDLKKEMRKNICDYLKPEIVHSIDQGSSEARKVGMMIDEEDKYCQEGKKLAAQVISSMGGKTTNTCKTEMLPLQGTLWSEWSCKLKEKQNVGGKGEGTIHESSRIDQEMVKLRDKQLKVCRTLSPLMRTFIINMVRVEESPIAVPYLQWLKIYLDDESRKTLPVLRHNYHETWKELKDVEKSETEKSKSKVSDRSTDTLHKELKKQERLLVEASLGLEHLFREMAQIYEAVVMCNLESMETIINRLPAFTARMLLQGIPVEIMDGDAANVPVTWVKAVFRNLQTNIGEKKCLVTSVLGIQSSGKSTLLNTMFGLQFAVSAGRCTRGVYMQLVKVDKQRSDVLYDYIMVCDTEGLRAPELGQLKHNNDNQLATFVIGLGDVTILNIKGENATEVSDILQIVVHAFLKMKQSNNNFMTHRTCLFVHQNVPAVNAKSQMDQGTKMLQEKLDTMTKEVCSIENILDINSFNQVMEFDSEKNVWYFTDLWHGSPPMAPVNRGYTRNVQEVRDYLLERFAQREQAFLTISDKSTHVEDLWNGVLSQDFVFCFKNTLAAKAYNSLEKKYNDSTWIASCNITKWLNKDAIVALDRCTTETDLDHQKNELCTRLFREGSEEKKKTCSTLEQFFESHDLKAILVEWKSKKVKGLRDEIDRYIKSAKQTIQQRIDSKKVHLRQTEKFAGIESEIMKRARDLADSMEGKMADEHEIQNKFDDFWGITVSELVPRNAKEQLSIHNTVEDLLYKWLEKDGELVRLEIGERPLTKYSEINELQHSFEIQDINDTLLSLDTGIVKQIKQGVKHFFGGQDRMTMCKHRALESINAISKDVDLELREISKKDSDFNENFAESVVRMVVNGVEQQNKILKDKHSFTMVSGMKVKIAIHACRHAVKVFNKMREKYHQKHDMHTQLEQKKTVNWILFKNMVNQCTNEVIAADLLLGQLELLVKQSVQQELTRKVVNEIVRHFTTKHSLLTKLLEGLTEKSFQECVEYVRNAKAFALGAITTITNDDIFCVKDTNEISKFIQFVKKDIHDHEESIKEKIKATNHSFKETGDKNFSSWLKRFIILLTELPVNEQTLNGMMDLKVEDFDNLQTLLIERLPKMGVRLLKGFKQKTPDTQKWEGRNPYKQILDRLWGCEAQCPFCKEVCQRGIGHVASNDHHQCIQHRPTGVGGIRLRTNGALRVESCNFEIQSNTTFLYANLPECKVSASCVEGKYYPYREYKKFLPDWKISPSSDMESSKYWMWFMAKYKKELADQYNAKVPDIPKDWNEITEQQAKKSLYVDH